MATTTKGHRLAKPATLKTKVEKPNLLLEISTSIEDRPSAGVIYGPSGVGKSTTVGNIPKAIVQPMVDENTWGNLKRAGAVPATLATLPPAETWEGLMDGIHSLLNNDHDYASYVLDSISSGERKMHEHVCLESFAGDWTDRGFMGYMRGYEVALTDLRELLDLLDRLRDERKMSVFLLGHSIVKTHRDPRLAPFDRHVCDLHHKSWAVLHRWCDFVFFMDFLVDVTEESGGRGKGHGGDERQFFVQYDASYDAKNRFGLTESISAGDDGTDAWTNISSAVKAARKVD
jgi:hypothetical protein